MEVERLCIVCSLRPHMLSGHTRIRRSGYLRARVWEMNQRKGIALTLH